MSREHKKIEGWLAEVYPGREKLLDAYAHLSMREIAIVGSAAVDVGLAELLSLRLYGDAGDKTKFLDLDGVESNAMARSFGARTALAYHVGIIGAQDRKAIDALRSIRNRMAHRVKVPFDDKVIQQHLSTLKGYVATLFEKSGQHAIAGTARAEVLDDENKCRQLINNAVASVQVLFEALHKHMLPLPTLMRQHKMKAAEDMIARLGAQAGVPDPDADDEFF